MGRVHVQLGGEGGHLTLLQWLRANDCSWDEYACSHVARGRHLTLLQWLRANGCDWNAITCMQTVEGDHLEVLQ